MVNARYWPLYRYNPALKSEGRNPFMLDSKAPDGTLREFLSGEIRYASLAASSPEDAHVLQMRLEEEVRERYESLQKMAAPGSPPVQGEVEYGPESVLPERAAVL